MVLLDSNLEPIENHIQTQKNLKSQVAKVAKVMPIVNPLLILSATYDKQSEHDLRRHAHPRWSRFSTNVEQLENRG